MTESIITWFWLVAGLVLIIVEVNAPSFIVGFFGLGALLVAAARWLGFFGDFTSSVLAWFFGSTILLVLFRKAAMKLSPPETSFELTDEDVEAIGQIVEVVESVNEKHGRIRFRGTSWPATTKLGTIPSGQKARIVYRNNLAWIVEPYQEPEEITKENVDS